MVLKTSASEADEHAGAHIVEVKITIGGSCFFPSVRPTRASGRRRGTLRVAARQRYNKPLRFWRLINFVGTRDV